MTPSSRNKLGQGSLEISFSETAGASSRPKGVTVFLSIYLLLVAFFIVLNTISVIDDKKIREVMDSMQTTFRPVSDPTISSSPFISDIGQLAQEAMAFVTISDFIQKSIPLAKIDIIKPHQSMSAAIALESLFLPDQVQLTDNTKRFLNHVAKVIRVPPPGLRYEAKITLPPGNFSGERKNRPSLAIERAGVIARHLQARGINSDTILIGIKPDLGNEVEFNFEVLNKKEGFLNFENLLTNNE